MTEPPTSRPDEDALLLQVDAATDGDEIVSAEPTDRRRLPPTIEELMADSHFGNADRPEAAAAPVPAAPSTAAATKADIVLPDVDLGDDPTVAAAPLEAAHTADDDLRWEPDEPVDLFGNDDAIGG